MTATIKTKAGAITRRDIELKPSEFYRVIGTDAERYSQGTLIFNCAMYVRTEKVNFANWHIFAALESNTSTVLTRVRFLSGDGEFGADNHGRIIPDRGLVTKAIIFPRSERAESVNTFIEEAHRLIREGPNRTTFKQDAYDAAGIYGSYREKVGKLKLVIEHYMMRDA